MIYFKFLIDWPFKKSKIESDDDDVEDFDLQRDYIMYDKKLSKNKNLEIQFTKWAEMDELFNIELDTRWCGRDHAGAHFELTIWKFFFNIQIYDSRHWNDETNSWEVYE